MRGIRKMDDLSNAFKVLKAAVGLCYCNDKSLIDRGMEQACVARIFYYMQKIAEDESLLSEYNIDCEYNKNGEHVKRTPRCPNGARPDLIVHKREENSMNLLVVEFKSCRGRKKWLDLTTLKVSKTRGVNCQDMDVVKLEDFTSRDCYGYKLGVFVKLKKSGAEYSFFRGGHSVQDFQEIL